MISGIPSTLCQHPRESKGYTFPTVSQKTAEIMTLGASAPSCLRGFVPPSKDHTTLTSKPRGQSGPLSADLTGLDFQDAQTVADLFDRAAAANQRHPLRQGCAVCPPAPGVLLMTGDLHDHGPNFSRILQLAALDRDANHHLVLHEVIHGPHRVNGRDTSVRMLAQAAALQLRYPRQVHVLQSNHELAQLNREGLMKGGLNVVQAFDLGLAFVYADDAPLVRAAMNQYLCSLPLAVRCPNGVFCCHSLPSAAHLSGFDTTVLNRTPTPADLAPGGSVHRMVWGRHHTQEVADVLGRAWNARLFVMGHQPAEMGFQIEGQSILVLASDHNHGMALPLDLSDQTCDLDGLIDRLVPLASVLIT